MPDSLPCARLAASPEGKLEDVAMNDFTTLSQRADAHEAEMARELDTVFIKSRWHLYAEGKMELPPSAASLLTGKPDSRVSMGDDPRLPAMPAKPTLIDFFTKRFGPSMHLLQSAHHAKKNGLPEKMVLACLLHDISVVGFIRGDHGYWGAQLVEPYVDEEVTWAIRAHQVLRFYADEAAGYEYRNPTSRCSAPSTGPTRTSRKTTSGCVPTSGTCTAARSRCTTSTRSIRTCTSSSRSSP